MEADGIKKKFRHESSTTTTTTTSFLPRGQASAEAAAVVQTNGTRNPAGIGASIIEAVEEIVIAAIRVWRHTSAHRKSHPSLIGSDHGEQKNAATTAGAKKFSNPFT